jgi:hypothetical protein
MMNPTSIKRKVVSFAEMATLITCRCTDDPSREEFESWWKESDYETFRKTSRILAMKILDEDGRQWLQSQAATAVLDSNGKTTINEDDGCWWRAYGHSRRGLEGLVSIAEGRHRRRITKESIRLVLELQQKSKENNSPSSVGVTKSGSSSLEEEIRNVYYHATTWCRTLAWAAAAADAEAVLTCDDHPRPREYFLSQAMQQKNKISTENTETHRSSAGLTTPSTSENPMHMERIKSLSFPNPLDERVLVQICHRKAPDPITTTTALTTAETSMSTMNTLGAGLSHTHHSSPTISMPSSPPPQCSTLVMRTVDTPRT